MVSPADFENKDEIDGRAQLEEEEESRKRRAVIRRNARIAKEAADKKARAAGRLRAAGIWFLVLSITFIAVAWNWKIVYKTIKQLTN
jgi:hypothetical protein